MTTPKLSMPELVVGQAGKELTHNQALAILDQLAQAVVIDKDLATPPGSPADGAMYIVAAGATGAWAGQDGKLAFWLASVGAWTFVTPTDGWHAWVADESVRYERVAGVWWRLFGGSSIRLAYGVQPSAWGSTFTTIDLGLGFVLGNSSNFFAIGTNLYNDGTNYRYKATAGASAFGFVGNVFNVAVGSGAAGSIATLTTTLGVDTSGNVIQQNPSGLLGYGTGAGGTVTQATNKATGVTLNKPCGQITMNAASLAANTAVSFTLTNSLIALTDNVTVNIQSGAATGGAYTVAADAGAAGSCRISLRNQTGGALAEALVLNFQLNKAVIA